MSPGRDATPGQFVSGCQGRLTIYWDRAYPASPATGAFYPNLALARERPAPRRECGPPFVHGRVSRAKYRASAGGIFSVSISKSSSSTWSGAAHMT